MDVDETNCTELFHRKGNGEERQTEADCFPTDTYPENILRDLKRKANVCTYTDSRFNLANFMRVNLYTALGALKTGMDILKKEKKAYSQTGL